MIDPNYAMPGAGFQRRWPVSQLPMQFNQLYTPPAAPEPFATSIDRFNYYRSQLPHLAEVVPSADPVGRAIDAKVAAEKAALEAEPNDFAAERAKARSALARAQTLRRYTDEHSVADAPPMRMPDFPAHAPRAVVNPWALAISTLGSIAAPEAAGMLMGAPLQAAIEQSNQAHAEAKAQFEIAARQAQLEHEDAIRERRDQWSRVTADAMNAGDIAGAEAALKAMSPLEDALKRSRDARIIALTAAGELDKAKELYSAGQAELKAQRDQNAMYSKIASDQAQLDAKAGSMQERTQTSADARVESARMSAQSREHIADSANATRLQIERENNAARMKIRALAERSAMARQARKSQTAIGNTDVDGMTATDRVLYSRALTKSNNLQKSYFDAWQEVAKLRGLSEESTAAEWAEVDNHPLLKGIADAARANDGVFATLAARYPKASRVGAPPQFVGLGGAKAPAPAPAPAPAAAKPAPVAAKPAPAAAKPAPAAAKPAPRAAVPAGKSAPVAAKPAVPAPKPAVSAAKPAAKPAAWKPQLKPAPLRPGTVLSGRTSTGNAYTVVIERH